ncbi:MAG: glycoside hydrolase family 3 C-terminal domain-containing protein [Anaerolineales bacterium]|nr:glycoside hydrolase family 3 C-terminal domain-containing protein [Anaerolineales bacterium]
MSEKYILSPEFRSLALDVASQSMVLLKNDKDILPLPIEGRRIALVGPLASNRADLLGTWAITGQAAEVETVLDGFQHYIEKESLTYVQGCSVSGDDHLDIPAVIAAAQESDVVVLVVGESSGMSGEAHSRVHLGLPGRQQELVNALMAVGKPLITVLMCGRPLVIPSLVDESAAFLVGWHGGIRAGKAVADILFGKVNPSGKLTSSWPRAEGQIPVYYSHKSTGRPAEGTGTTQFHEPFRSTYLDEPNVPLFSFGEGKSYSSFEYKNLQVHTPVVKMDGKLVVTATVNNISNRPGVEIIQFYVRDLVGSVTRPVKELKGFQRISLEAGQKCEVRFEVPVDALGFHGLDNQYRVEPGDYQIWVGPDSTSGLEGMITVIL